MERDFVNQVIAPALKEYGESIGLTEPDQFYRDMSWGGLDFNNNSSLSTADKERIGDTLQAEQTNSTVDGVTPKGTSNGC